MGIYLDEIGELTRRILIYSGHLVYKQTIAISMKVD